MRVVPLAVEHPASPSAAIRVTEVTVLSIEFFIPPIFRQLAKPQLCSGFFCAMSWGLPPPTAANRVSQHEIEPKKTRDAPV